MIFSIPGYYGRTFIFLILTERADGDSDAEYDMIMMMMTATTMILMIIKFGNHINQINDHNQINDNHILYIILDKVFRNSYFEIKLFNNYDKLNPAN